MMSQPGRQRTAISQFPIISSIKGSQTMKFGQLIECNMKNIFVEKSHTKYCGKTFLDLFLKDQN